MELPGNGYICRGDVEYPNRYFGVPLCKVVFGSLKTGRSRIGQGNELETKQGGSEKEKTGKWWGALREQLGGCPEPGPTLTRGDCAAW